MYSGHNAYWAWGPPQPTGRSSSTSATGGPPTGARLFTGCHVVARIDDGLGIDNGEQGKAGSGVHWVRGHRGRRYGLTLRTIS